MKKYLISVFFSFMLQYVNAQVLGVENLTIRTTRARKLFLLFTDSLGLPAVFNYQLMGTEPGGRIWMGNTAFSFTEAAAGITGLFSEISLEPVQHGGVLLETLKNYGIAHREPESIPCKVKNEEKPCWKNIGLTDLLADAWKVVITDDINPVFLSDQKKKAKKIFSERAGGSLGIVGVKQLVIGTTDPEKTGQAWVSIPGAKRKESNLFRFIEGPEIGLIKTATNEIKEIRIQVRSQAIAAAFLLQKGLLKKEGDLTLIDPAVMNGLRIVLVE